MSDPDLDALIAEWCERNLGAPPRRELFRSGHLSLVLGVELADGRSVVIKARPPSPRLRAVFEVQRILGSRGFPCPTPLAEPAPLAHLTATAETFVPRRGAPPEPPPPAPTAELLVDLVELAPSASRHTGLEPAPPWVGWDHDEGALWPPPDDLVVDMNQSPGPDWIDETARRLRVRLAGTAASPMIGHVDWEAQNIDWADGIPVVAHDWDSLAIRTEAAIAGAAAAVYPSNGTTAVVATVEQTDAFLHAYRMRRPAWSAADDAEAWAAGLWVMTYNAKKESLGGGTGYLQHLAAELDERSRLAGI